MLRFIIFISSLNFCFTQTSKDKKDDVDGINKKEEFRKWFQYINDPFDDGCELQSSSFLQNNDSKKTSEKEKRKTINVVECSSGLGNPNYKITVLYQTHFFVF